MNEREALAAGLTIIGGDWQARGAKREAWWDERGANRLGPYVKRDRHREACKKHYYENKPAINERHRRYYHANRQRVLAVQRDYYQRNRLRILARKRARYNKS